MEKNVHQADDAHTTPVSTGVAAGSVGRRMVRPTLTSKSVATNEIPSARVGVRRPPMTWRRFIGEWT